MRRRNRGHGWTLPRATWLTVAGEYPVRSATSVSRRPAAAAAAFNGEGWTDMTTPGLVPFGGTAAGRVWPRAQVDAQDLGPDLTCANYTTVICPIGQPAGACPPTR